MSQYNPKITEIIENAPEFERPVLKHLREIIHKACPEIEERISWSRPHYYYKGKGMLVTDALKERVTFGTWFELDVRNAPNLSKEAKDAIEPLGFLKSMDDLPSDKILIEIIHQAMWNIDNNVKVKSEKKPKPELVIPDYLTKALAKNKKAEENFNAMSPSHKREYVDWIVDAKTEETRERRIAQMIEMVLEKKSRYAKYQ